nr:MAG TPA_asm: hypothetical protein [Caudoviricetes sp.]
MKRTGDAESLPCGLLRAPRPPALEYGASPAGGTSPPRSTTRRARW